MKKFLFIILISFIFSQSITDYAYTGFEGTSLCGAVVANKGGSWSLYHNPAGLSEIKNVEFTFSFSKLYNQVFLPYNNADIILPIEGIGNFGISIQEMSVSYNGNDLSSEKSLGISQGFFLLKDMHSTLSLGYTIQFMNWNLGKSAGFSGDGSDGINLGSENLVGLDIGFQASLREKYRLGVFIKNFNQPQVGEGLSEQPLSRRLSIGTSYYPINGVMTALVLERLLGGSVQIKYGMKYQLSNILSVNIGAQSNPNRLGAGMSIKNSKINFNYSILTHHVLPVTHQISIGYIIDR